MSGYGYVERPPMPDRFVKGPPQAAPRSVWPRRVADAVKNQDTGTLRLVQQLVQSDAAPMWGLTPGSTNEGGPGTTTLQTDYWWADIARFCRYVEINATGANDKRLNRTELNYNVSPKALLDPSQPPAPLIWRFEDICAARLNAPAAGHTGAFHFGLTWENGLGVNLVAPNPFIGIYANWTGTAYGTWTARCVDDAGSGLNTSLGITTQDPHRLAYEIDGRGFVNFYIDGVLLLSYPTTGSDLGTHTIFAIGHRWTVAADDNGTIRAGYMMDMQAAVSVEVLDEAVA